MDINEDLDQNSDLAVLDRSIWAFEGGLFAYVISTKKSRVGAYLYLSYDISVIQWITSCHKKCYYHTLHNTFGGNK